MSTGVTGEVVERMHTEYLFAHNGKYTVAATIKKSEAVYLATHKENSATHDIYSVGVETNGTIDCRCNVRMGYPCRHIFCSI